MLESGDLRVYALGLPHTIRVYYEEREAPYEGGQTMVNEDEKLRKVVEWYVEAWKGRKELFEMAFHPDAWIFCSDSNRTVKKSLLTDCFDDWSSTNLDIDAEIKSITQLVDVGHVMLRFENRSNPSASFLDSLNSIKENDGWKITNKTASHKSRT